tara:strand:- start:41 stop:568 length:528 start_codon:yes stop_codon:yes gene_type:complete
MTYEVIDNFLPEYQFKQLESMMMSETFPWYYNDRIYGDHENKELTYQFIHVLYNIVPPWNGSTEYVEYGDSLKTNLELICSILNSSRLYRIKANTRPKTLFHRGCSGYHVDGTGSTHTSIFYINSNNGYTKFKKGGKVKSVENRMVIFPSDLEHQGFSCTDKQRRVLLNFNFDRL